MSNFIKVAIGVGAIGLIVLAFVIFYTGKKDAEHELERARHEKARIQFDKDFSESWNRGKANMADSEEEREFWEKKAEDDRKRLDIQEKEVDAKIEKAGRRFEGKTQDSDQFSEDFKKSLKESPDISEEEFKRKMKEAFEENQ